MKGLAMTGLSKKLQRRSRLRGTSIYETISTARRAGVAVLADTPDWRYGGLKLILGLIIQLASKLIGFVYERPASRSNRRFLSTSLHISADSLDDCSLWPGPAMPRVNVQSLPGHLINVLAGVEGVVSISKYLHAVGNIARRLMAESY